MKKSSFLRGRGVRVTTPTTLYAAAGVTLFLVVLLGMRLFAPDALLALMSPLMRAGTVTTASVSSAGSVFEGKASLEQDKERYATENARLIAENAQLRARVSDLTELVGTRTERSTGALAGIIARPPVSPYDVLVIDAGTEEGVRSGSVVLGAGGMPIGTVASVSKQNARVLLYSSPGRETEAWAGEKRTPMTLVGQGSGAVTAYAPRDAGIAPGDGVFVSGPGALAIGTVAEVHTDPVSPKSRIIIRPLVNPFSITWVTVDTNAP